MSSTIRRVPLDFDWPLWKTWQGYVFPDDLHGTRCTDCYGAGETPAAQWLGILCRQIEMLAADIGSQERGYPLHPWLAGNPYAACDRTAEPITRNGPWVEYPTIRPTADIVDLLAAVTGRPAADLADGWGSQNALYHFLVKAAGIRDWGMCRTCDGTGSVETYPGQRAAADAWESTDPPGGDGWQVWETVSYGSPITPVFPTREALIRYLCTPGQQVTRQHAMTRAQAEAYIDSGGSAGSFAHIDGVGVVGGALVPAIDQEDPR